MTVKEKSLARWVWALAAALLGAGAALTMPRLVESRTEATPRAVTPRGPLLAE